MGWSSAPIWSCDMLFYKHQFALLNQVGTPFLESWRAETTVESRQLCCVPVLLLEPELPRCGWDAAQLFCGDRGSQRCLWVIATSLLWRQLAPRLAVIAPSSLRKWPVPEPAVFTGDDCVISSEKITLDLRRGAPTGGLTKPTTSTEGLQCSLVATTLTKCNNNLQPPIVGHINTSRLLSCYFVKCKEKWPWKISESAEQRCKISSGLSF